MLAANAAAMNAAANMAATAVAATAMAEDAVSCFLWFSMVFYGFSMVFYGFFLWFSCFLIRHFGKSWNFYGEMEKYVQKFIFGIPVKIVVKEQLTA